MKFGQQLTAHLTPEWRKQYICYEDLKRILYDFLEKAPPPETDEAVRHSYIAKTDEQFFAMCEVELTKMNLFYSQKLAEAQGKFHELTRDLEAFKRIAAVHAGESFRSPLKMLKNRKEEAKTVRFEKSKTSHQLKLAFSEFYLNLVLLQNYQQLNATGFRKILKKRDKIFDDNRGLEWRMNKVEKAPFYLNRELESLINSTEQCVITDLEGGDRSAGMKRLRVPPISEKQHAWTTFRLGLYSGCFLVLFFFIILTVSKDWYQDLRETPEPPWVGVRLFRGFFMLFVNIWLVGINMYGWQGAGVNHVLIFEINPRQHLTYQSLMEMGSFLCMLWAVAVLGYLYAPYFHAPPLIFPLALLGVCGIWLLNPISVPECMNRSSRYWFFTHIYRCFSAPFHFVTFPDFWLADQMNSLVTFFLDMGYLTCFYTVSVDYSNGTMAMKRSNGTYEGQDFGVDDHGHDFCSSNAYGIRPLISIIPSLLRFLQCLRRFKDTKHRHPHLTNAGKYSTSFFVVAFGAMFNYYASVYKAHGDSNPFLYLWIFAYIVSFIYTYSWDIIMDWGLLRSDATRQNRFLRESLVYDHRFFYYFAIVEDFVLRLSWVGNVSLGIRASKNKEVLICITAPLECFRRFVWNYFRLENEHLNNCGEFRAVRDISVKPIRKGDLDELLKKMDLDDGILHRCSDSKTLTKKKRTTKAKLKKKESRLNLPKWAFSKSKSSPVFNSSHGQVEVNIAGPSELEHLYPVQEDSFEEC